MSPKTTVVVAEDHQLFREGLKSMLAAVEALEIVGEAADGKEAIQCVRRLKPRMLILDLSMPKVSGISVIKDVKRELPDTIILVLSIHESDQFVLESFEAGADGYCIKDASRDELILAIESVLKGNTYISPGIADHVMEGYLTSHRKLKEKSDWDTVTHREREVLKLVAEGSTNQEIAGVLNISAKTVEKHRANIMSKLDLHNAAELTAFAIEKGLVEFRR